MNMSGPFIVRMSVAKPRVAHTSQRLLCDESLFYQNAKKREIPHFADSVRNDDFEVFQQAASEPALTGGISRLGNSRKSCGPSTLPSQIGARRVNKPPFEAQGKPHSKLQRLTKVIMASG